MKDIIAFNSKLVFWKKYYFYNASSKTFLVIFIFVMQNSLLVGFTSSHTVAPATAVRTADHTKTRLTRGARPALAGFFKARQYPCAGSTVLPTRTGHWCLTASRVCYNGAATVNAAKVLTTSCDGILSPLVLVS